MSDIPRLSTTNPRAGRRCTRIMSRLKLRTLLLIAALPVVPAFGERQMETLDRGLVAMRGDDGSVRVSWRLLADDPAATAFHLYRVTAGKAERMTDRALADATFFTDPEPGNADAYFVRPVLDAEEGAASGHAEILARPFIEIPLKPIDGYGVGDCSTGDLDGDGRYEIIVHRTSKGRDNSFAGITGSPVFDAYKLDGTHLWRIDLGINIREGEHYTQFMVYDLDGDGRAELACKTADGTIDGNRKNHRRQGQGLAHTEPDSLKHGRILERPGVFHHLRRPHRCGARNR
jgi:rhamnogalacturonan endolyase